MTTQKIEYRLPQFGQISKIVILIGSLTFLSSVIISFIKIENFYAPVSFIFLSISTCVLGGLGGSFSTKAYTERREKIQYIRGMSESEIKSLNDKTERFLIGIIFILPVIVIPFDKNVSSFITCYSVSLSSFYLFIFCYVAIFYCLHKKNTEL